MEFLRRLISQPFMAPDGGGDGGAGGEGGNGGAGNGNGDGDQNNNAGGGAAKFSQEDVDAIITKRLAREQKAWEAKLEEEKKKANMTEQEKLKAAAEEAEKKGKVAVDAANARIIAAEAKVQAAALGVKPEKVAYVLKLADLSGVAVDDNGNIDEKEVKKAVEKVTKDLPELLAGGTGGANLRGNPGGKAGQGGGMNAFLRQATGRV